MGNHTIDCDICGEDLRGLSGGHEYGCPGEKASEKEIEVFVLKRKILRYKAALKQSRLALEGMVSFQSAKDLIDNIGDD